MSFTTRPTLRGYGGGVAAGHYLATSAGQQILAEGGNAADAAVTMGLCLQVLEPHMNGPAGEVPILIYWSAEDRVYAISGQGIAPAGTTIERFTGLGLDRVPGDGLLGATVPAALDAWCQLLERFGTRRFCDVAGPARALAQNGFPLYPFLGGVLRFLEKRFATEWPSSAALYPAGRKIGERQCNPDYAAVLAELMDAERSKGGTREAGIRAARDAFYRGRPAELIEAFLKHPVRDASGREHAGLLTADDLANYTGAIETPVSTGYRGATVWKCGPWTQGPVFLQQLRLAEAFDFGRLDHNGVDHLHTWLECAKLAMADREANYGDPMFVDVPLDALLSDEYTKKRQALIHPELASLRLRPGMGRLPAGWPWLADGESAPAEPQALAAWEERAERTAASGRGDTTHLDAVDRHGNVVSATPSGAWIPSSPVIPGLGFPVGTRAQMFSLDPAHPNALAPGKRPRTTLTPSLARLGDGRLMAFGTPGGDQQDQWTLQFFQNLVDFETRDLQAAIDAPTVHTAHMPDSFYPRETALGVAYAEERVDPDVLTGLESRGHLVRRSGPWQHGRVLAVTHDPETGLCEAAASPRSVVAYAGVLG